MEQTKANVKYKQVSSPQKFRREKSDILGFCKLFG